MQSILGYIKQRGLFQGITRFQYLKYNMEDSLEIVTAIGKRRNPALKFSVEVVPSATHWKRKPKKHCGNSVWMLPSTMCGTLKKSPLTA